METYVQFLSPTKFVFSLKNELFLVRVSLHLPEFLLLETFCKLAFIVDFSWP